MHSAYEIGETSKSTQSTDSGKSYTMATNMSAKQSTGTQVGHTRLQSPLHLPTVLSVGCFTPLILQLAKGFFLISPQTCLPMRFSNFHFPQHKSQKSFHVPPVLRPAGALPSHLE